MACLASGPLASPQPAFKTNFMLVLTHLDKPLVQSVDAKELVSLAAVIDVAAERAAKVKGAAFTQQQRLARLEALCRVLAPKQEPADTLAALGLAEAYPFLAAHMAGGKAQPSSSGSGAAHLHYVSLLNQVVQMGTQLYHDALVPHHHKYTAHQIALLYQSLNMLQGDTKPIRRLVESRFDDIKAVTEGGAPVLPVETSTWLQTITWLCREEVAAFPGYIHKRVASLARLAAGDTLQQCMRSCSRGEGSPWPAAHASSGGAEGTKPAPGQLAGPQQCSAGQSSGKVQVPQQHQPQQLKPNPQQQGSQQQQQQQQSQPSQKHHCLAHPPQNLYASPQVQRAG